jgi:hypothetical protein
MIENLLGGGGGGGGTVDTIQAGTGISVDSTNPASPIITNTSLNTDEVAKVSSNDTTAGYLNGKLVAGTGVSFTENNNGGNETLTIASTVVNTDETAKVSSNDTTAGYLNGKLVAGTNITLTENNNGGNETLTIAAAGDTTYAVTLADAENTTSQITLAQFTIPANTWAQGEEVVLDLHSLSLNSTGSTQSVTYVVGGTTIADQSSGSVTAGGVQAVNGFARTRLRFVRVGTGVAYSIIGTNSPSTVYGFWDGNNAPIQGGAGTYYDSAVTFTSDITIYLKATLGLASASYYIRTEHARAYKVPVGSL